MLCHLLVALPVACLRPPARAPQVACCVAIAVHHAAPTLHTALAGTLANPTADVGCFAASGQGWQAVGGATRM